MFCTIYNDKKIIFNDTYNMENDVRKNDVIFFIYSSKKHFLYGIVWTYHNKNTEEYGIIRYFKMHIF